ncbi:MAG: LysR family transcriptional regulator [Pseudomonadota bacterium]
MDEFSRIQTFINVVEAGSFSAAARHISSVSAVARQVKSLEDELGVRLLQRSTRRLSLTEPGRLFYERMCAVAHDLRNAKSEAQSFQETVKGVLRVSLRVVTGPTIIVPALPRLLSQYPELSVEVSLTDEKQNLIMDNIDVAVWMGDLPNSDLIARRLNPGHRIVCGSPAYLSAMGIPKKPSDLRSHKCIVYSAHSYTNRWSFSKNGNVEEVVVNGGIRSDNGLVLLSSALAGTGLVLVHDWMVRLPLSSGQLVQVLDGYTVNPRPGDAEFFAVYTSSRGLSKKVRVFVDFLVNLFNEDAA